MKKQLLILSVLAGLLAGCSDSFNFPANPTEDTLIEIVTPPDTAGMNIPAEAITVAQAIAIGDSIGPNGLTKEKYYIKGFVKKFGSKHADGITGYGNATFYIYDGKSSGRDFEAYQIYGINGKPFTSLEQILVGDYVVVCGQITNYNGTIETPGKGEAYLYASNNAKAYQDFSPEIIIDTTGCITCAQAIAQADGHAVVVGYAARPSAKSGKQQTVWMSDDPNDENGTFEAYLCNVNGEVVKGDFIAVEGDITVYNTITEIKNGNMVVLRQAPRQYDYFIEDFAAGMGSFTIQNDDNYPIDIWTAKSGDYPCMQAYAVNGEDKIEATSRLVSPALDLSEAVAPKLTFSHYHQQAASAQTELTLEISRDGITWTPVTIPTYSGGTKPTYVSSGDIDLTALAGSDEARIAFVYKSTTASAPRWCVRNILISEYK
jgi:hypothetical protein